MDIKTFSPTSHKIKAVIYGASGAGKTYFAATAPKPIFASAEAGLLSTINHKKKIDPIKYIEVKKLEDLRDLLAHLQKGEHEFKTVVIDSISEINEIIKDGIEKKRGSAMIQKDWGDLFKAIKGILRGFRDLNMHVIFIAQEKVEKDEQKTEKIVPMLNGKAAVEIAYFMDIVAYCYVDKNGENKITVQPSERLLTKCRGIELEGDAPDDFEQWITAIEQIQLQAEAVESVQVNHNVAVPAKEEPKKVRIQADTSRALFAEWRKFYDATGKDPKQALPTLKATLKKEFNVDSSRELSEEQARSFVDRLSKHNKASKQKAKEAAKEEPAAEVVEEKKEEQQQEMPVEEMPEKDLTSTPESETIKPE